MRKLQYHCKTTTWALTGSCILREAIPKFWMCIFKSGPLVNV